MNKSEFLKYLEKRLSVLNKKEREDIIQEYSQHIDMKVKSGLTEYEAIKDFGDLKAFVDEILEAYNIDPGYEEEGYNAENNVINKAKRGLRSAAEFIFSQNPSVIAKMLIKILIAFGILFVIVSLGFIVLYAVFSELCSYYIPEFIGAAFIGAYMLIAVSIAVYILYIYIKRLAANISTYSNTGISLFSGIKKGIDRLVDFILSQRPISLMFMSFKIFIMAAVIFVIGLIGMLIPAVITAILASVIDVEEFIFLIYLLIAVPAGIYVLFCYIARLANNMYRRSVKTRNIENKAYECVNVQDNNLSGITKSDTAETHKKSGIQGGQMLGDVFFESVGKFIKSILHFSWRVVIVIFKLSVLAGLAMFMCVLIPAIVFTCFALVFLILGYPAIGIFMMSLGFCISAASFIIIVLKLLFYNSAKEKRESI